MMMWSSILPLVVLVGLLAMLPWGIRWMQRRVGGATNRQWFSSNVISSVAVGPQQQVVTVEVGPQGARAWLVLGVTSTQVTCLHTIQRDGDLDASTPDITLKPPIMEASS